MAAKSAQGTRVYISNGAAPVTHVISAVSKASPAVVTVVSPTGIAVGDIVVPKDTGFKSIDDFPFRVATVATNDITLEDSDTSDETGTVTAGSLDEVTLVELCVANFTTDQPAGTVQDVTTMCDVARRTIAGLPGQGTWTANGFHDGADASQQIAREAYRSRDDQVFRLVFRDGSGVLFGGVLNQLNIGAAVDAPVTIALGGTINGRVQFQDTP